MAGDGIVSQEENTVEFRALSRHTPVLGYTYDALART